MAEKKEKQYVSDNTQQSCKAGIRKTHQEFCTELTQLNPQITPLDEYVSAYTKIRFRCEECGHEWTTAPTNIISKKHGCPLCARKRGTSKRTKSHEAFVQEVYSANRNIEILTPYSGAHNKVACRCRICGHEWSGRPDHLKNGIGCPKCAGNARKTTSSFVDEISTLHPNIEILSEYLSADEKVECKCRICKNTWKAVPNSLLSGSGCPHCFKRYKTSFSEQAVLFYIKKYYSDTAGTYSKDGNEFDVYIPEINTAVEYDGVFWHKDRLEHDNLKDSFAVDNGIELIRIRECGLPQTLFAKNIFRKDNSEEALTSCIVELLMLLGVDSPTINLNSDRIEILNSYYSKLKTGSLAETNPSLAAEWHPTKNMEVTPYMVSPNSGKKFWWQCSSCGFEWEASLDKRSKGRGCPVCSRDVLRNIHLKSHEQFIREVCELNPEIIVLGKYISSRTAIACKCKQCDSEFSITPHDILQGRKCPRCTKNEKILRSRKSQKVFLEEIATIHPNLEVLDLYINAKHPLRCRCKKCGYIWETIPDRLCRGAGCPKCAGNARLSHEEFVDAVRKQNPEIEILGEYRRSTDKIHYKCMRCGYIGDMRASHLKEGHGCPQCAKEKRKKN